jgi:thiamine pyrophosphate-dependent acetolactate synthase large subunit-like protein
VPDGSNYSSLVSCGVRAVAARRTELWEDAMKNVLDGGEAIIQAFRNLDIDYVVSSPGSEWGPLWEAFARQQVDKTPGPKYIHCYHETLAVNVATAYATVTGKLQAVVLHAGVGLMQGSMGVHGAKLAGAPIMVLSGESLSYGENESFDPGHQWYESLSIPGGPQRLMEPVTKWATQASSPSTLYEHVVRIGELAMRTPAGPTYLNVPIENMVAPWSPPAKMRKVPHPVKAPAPAAEIEKVAGLLASAKNPVIVTETGGRDPESWAALVALAESLSIPVVEGSVADCNNFPQDHPLHQGYDVKPFLDSADLVLVVRARAPWYPPHKGPPNATVVVIDEYALRDHMVYQNMQANAFLEGDVPSTLRSLVEAVKAAGVKPDAVKERLAQYHAAHEKLVAGYAAARAKVANNKIIHPITLAAALNEVMPKNTAYTDECTTHRGINVRQIQFGGPQSFFKVPSGLGQGLGIALGVKLALKDRPVVSLIGDGAFLYNPVPQSLGLARDANLPIMIVVYNNKNYRAMRNNQTEYYPDGVGVKHNLFYGAPINGPDYGELAPPWGGVGIKIDDPAKLKDGLKKGRDAIESGKLALVNVEIDP